MPRPIFFLHIPKTAGTSVNQLLAGLYDAPSAQHIELHKQWHSPEFWARYPFVSGHINIEAARKYAPSSFVFVTFLRDPWKQFLSVLRYQYAISAPATSHLFHYVGPRMRTFSDSMHATDLEEPKQFERWLSTTGDLGNRLMDNFQTRFLTSVKDADRVSGDTVRSAMKNLQSIPCAGIVEMMDDSLRQLATVAELDMTSLPAVQNLNTRLAELPGLDTPAIKEICAPLFKYDQELYQFGCRLLASRTRFLEDRR